MNRRFGALLKQDGSTPVPKFTSFSMSSHKQLAGAIKLGRIPIRVFGQNYS